MSARVTRKPRVKRAAHLSPVQKKQVKRLIGNRQEHKYLRNAIVAGTASNVGSLSGAITAIAQGGTVNQREADRAMLTEVELRYSFIASDATQTMRIIVFQWKSDNSADPPIVADILDLASATGTLANYNLSAESNKFKILADRSVAMTLAGDAARIGRIRIFGKKLTKSLKFNAGATTHDNGVYVLVISDSAVVAHPTYSWESVIRYTDS